MNIKTWIDLEKAAHDNAVLRRVVDVVRSGHLTREEALIALAFHFTETQTDWIQMEVERRSREIAPIFVEAKNCPVCDRRMSMREAAEQAICNDCSGVVS